MELTLEQFVVVVQESGLLSHALLDSILREQEIDGGSPDPAIVANALMAQKIITPWQAEKLLSGVNQGFFLGKHKLLRLIASGSMSTVYEAEHLLLHRRVAIKVLPKSLVGETSFLERFYREARAVVRLDHPNVIRGFDVGQDGDYHYFVMEYLEGSSLQDLVEASGPFSFETAAEMIRQAALGLEHAHKAGMIHRDIKPANILRDLEGNVKLLDLGLVRSLPHEVAGEAGLTRIHDESVLGTVDYLSPEQAIDSHNVDIRSDIYSLGCTLYFLLSGEPPFAKGTLTERLLAHQTRSPTPLSELRKDLPKGLGLVVARMLEKRPDQRYQTPEDVATALGEWILLNRGATSEVTESGQPVEKTAASKALETIPAMAKSPGPALPGSGSWKASRGGASSRKLARSALTTVRSQDPPSAIERAVPDLSVSWARWAAAVEATAKRRSLNPPLTESSYRQTYEDLLAACRATTTDPEAEPATREMLREIEDLASPWTTLQVLRSILASEMNASIIVRFHDLDRHMRVPVQSIYNRPLSARVVASIIATLLIGFASFVYWPDPPDATAPRSLISQTRQSIKKKITALLETIVN